MGDSRKLRGAMLLTAMLAAASAAGCAGPSTRILPRESREQRREPMSFRFLRREILFICRRSWKLLPLLLV